MNSKEICPQCGMLLLGDAGAGLCPKCLGSLGFASSAPDDGSAALHRLGDYELLSEIARGGMGVVFKARQISLNRIVAVKVVLHGPFSSPEFVTRFRTEVAAIASLRHPNIVGIYEAGQSGNDHFFSMEYIEGQSLAHAVREQPLPVRRSASYLKDVALAVDYAHQRGVLHRDLKPSNILLDALDQPRVTDFGLAKLLNSDAELTTTGQVLGSPSYISPEQAAGTARDFGASGDVYSLGAILYHLLTGRPPFQGETVPQVLAQVLADDPVPPRRLNPSVSVDLQTICLKCLQKEPARRYPSAQALAEDLGRFLANEPIRARPVSFAEKIWLWCRRRPLLAALTVALNLVLVFGILGILWQWRRAEHNAEGERAQRHAAEDYAARMRLNLYAGDISFAAQAWQRGNLGLARHTLAALKPQAGEEDLRGFEWRNLWSQCGGDQLATLTGHDGIVTCATFSPDGKFIASGSRDQTVRIWGAGRWEFLTTLNAATGAVWTVKFTPDSRFLVTSGEGGTRLWDCASWKCLKTFPGETASLAQTAPLVAVSEVSLFSWWKPAHPVSVWNYLTGEKVRDLPKSRVFALSPDGALLALKNASIGIELWDVASGELRRTLTESNTVRELKFSPDGNQLLVLSGKLPPRIHDLRSNLPPTSVPGHTMDVFAADFSPDGATLATVSSDQTLRLTDLATLQTKQILRGHESEVWCVAFSADGKNLVTGGKDQKVLLWSSEPLPGPPVIRHWSSLVKPFFSPDGKRLVAFGAPGARGASSVWDVETGLRVRALTGRKVIGFSPDGTRLVRWRDDERGLEFLALDSTNVTEVALAGTGEKIRDIVYDGFSADRKTFYATDRLSRVGIWDLATGRLKKWFQSPAPPISTSAISPDGRWLALASVPEKFIRLYDLESGRETQFHGHLDTVRGLDFSPDGATLASGSLDGTIRLWNVTNGAALGVLPGHMEEATGVAFSPDGRTLASVNVRHSLKLWHIATRRELASWDAPQVGGLLQFSPDGTSLAVTLRTNAIWLLKAPALETLEKPGR